MSLYLSVDLDQCRRQRHRFRIIGSDKTPLKVSLMCVTCTDANHLNTIAAYGDDLKSWGLWRTQGKEER